MSNAVRRACSIDICSGGLRFRLHESAQRDAHRGFVFIHGRARTLREKRFGFVVDTKFCHSRRACDHVYSFPNSRLHPFNALLQGLNHPCREVPCFPSTHTPYHSVSGHPLVVQKCGSCERLPQRSHERYVSTPLYRVSASIGSSLNNRMALEQGISCHGVVQCIGGVFRRNRSCARLCWCGLSFFGGAGGRRCAR